MNRGWNMAKAALLAANADAALVIDQLAEKSELVVGEYYSRVTQEPRRIDGLRILKAHENPFRSNGLRRGDRQ